MKASKAKAAAAAVEAVTAGHSRGGRDHAALTVELPHSLKVC